jgi:hypothetical protein
MYKDDAGNWGRLSSASLSYPRPKGATPHRTPLVPSYQQCTDPDRVHGPPLDDPSCSSPAQQSGTLTVGSPDANGSVANSSGFVRLDVMLGNPNSPEDEADVGISIDVTDVRCAVTNAACPSGQGSDYTGRLLATSTVRITDKFNGPSQEQDGTVVDTRLEIPFGCTTTAGTGIGAHCAVNTTMDALLPGAVVEGGRAVWQTGAVEIQDAGPNGTGYGNGCPATCGDGDEAVFMRQGIFVP